MALDYENPEADPPKISSGRPTLAPQLSAGQLQVTTWTVGPLELAFPSGIFSNGDKIRSTYIKYIYIIYIILCIYIYLDLTNKIPGINMN